MNSINKSSNVENFQNRSIIDSIKSILSYILENDKFIVTSHMSPDGDNIGSSLAMYYFLKKLGKNVFYILDDEYPSNLRFLYDENIKRNSDYYKGKGIDFKEYTVIALDSGDYSRICMSEGIIEKTKGIICIDHHVSNDGYGFLNYVDSEASSTCELVYNIISVFEVNSVFKRSAISRAIKENSGEFTSEVKVNNDEVNIGNKSVEKILDKHIATVLYTGLTTDTGNFQYSNTNPSSFLMAARLLEYGADKNRIIENIYQNNSLKFYKILGEVLDSLEIVEERISVAVVTKEMLDRFEINYDDIDSITPYTRDIEGVELGVFIKEKNLGEIKVSFRSKTYIDCSELAKNFGGGGHKRAAGCTIKDKNTEEVRKMLIDEVVKIFK